MNDEDDELLGDELLLELEVALAEELLEPDDEADTLADELELEDAVVDGDELDEPLLLELEDAV